jgi:hypothetical protein
LAFSKNEEPGSTYQNSKLLIQTRQITTPRNMNALQTKIGTLAFSECEKFIRLSLASTLSAFLTSLNQKTKVSDIKSETVQKFIDDFSPQPTKATPKRTDTNSAWQGFAKQFRIDFPGSKTKEIGKAWNKGTDVSKEDWDRYVKIGNAPPVEKVREMSTGNAWSGFLSNFKSLNANKDPDDESKLDGNLAGAAAGEWKKVKKSLTATQLAKYQKIADKIKAEKKKAEKKKEDARLKREKTAAAKKAADKAKEETESNAESDSDDDMPLKGSDTESDETAPCK